MKLHAVVEDVIAEIDVFIPDCHCAEQLIRFMVCITDGNSLSIIRVGDDERGRDSPRMTFFHGVGFGGVADRVTMLADLASSDPAAHGES